MCTAAKSSSVSISSAEMLMVDTRGDCSRCHNCVLCPSDMSVPPSLSCDHRGYWVYEHWFCSDACRFEFNMINN